MAGASGPGGGLGGTPTPGGFGGPGGAGGGTQADFDSLIELITSTIDPTTWDSVGGTGSIAKFETNLSLVISQTQEVHEKIVDLLEQLRRMQDLQVTIEVRFITLNDSFFEYIGVDFDFTLQQNTQNPTAAGFGPVTTSAVSGTPTRNYVAQQRHRRGGDADNTGTTPARIARSSPPTLDIPFTQGSYALAAPSVRRFRRHGRRLAGVCHPQQRRGVLLHQRRAGRQAQQRPAGPQGHALQRPAGVRLRHLADAVRDQRRPRGRRLRRRRSSR